MRLLSKVAIGGGAVSAVTAGALVVGGVFATSATLVAVDPGAAPAAADSLFSFNDCGELRDWYVDHNLSDVGPYGWGGRIYAMKGFDQRMGATVPEALNRLADATTAARGSSSTGTNTQEAAVDEPDVAKTDGTLLVRLTRPHGNDTDQVLVVSDVTGATNDTLARIHLPEASYDSQLLLVGTHVILTQSAGGYGNPIAYDTRAPFPIGPGTDASTRVLDIDISDPAHPQLVGTDVYNGSLISARQYGDVVRLVTDTGRPELKWRLPHKGFSAPQATAWNKKLVRESTIEDWLPTVSHAGQKKRLLDCSDLMHPKVWSGSDTIAVTTFKAAAAAERSSVGITAAGGIVYSSVDRLYVASTQWQEPHRGLFIRGGPNERIVAPGTVTTDLHAFALDGPKTTYLASGHIDGTIRDRWSLDEYDGYLRVAWSNQDRGRVQNGITVLKEHDHTLQEVGTLDGLGVDEDIQSVRWFDDLAIVVTFRQVDPLYTIDLSDPNTPRKLGALTVPGYSGYLHPIGHDLLLGLGVDGGGWGQAAVFDIKDLRHPVRISRIGFGSNSHLDALEEPRAFTWLPSAQTGLTVVEDWSTVHAYDRFRVEALNVGPGGETDRRTVAHLPNGWQPRILPLGDNRVAIVDYYRVQLVDLS
jgi:hypothetical protein